MPVLLRNQAHLEEPREITMAVQDYGRTIHLSGTLLTLIVPFTGDAGMFWVADPDWESRDGHYRVRLYGEWIDVPHDALITESDRAGQTMVWPMLFNGEISVRCFMPGNMT